MASTACFIIVSRNDIPIYEAEVGSAPKEEAAHQHQFILHAALDIVQDLAWTTSAMFLKAVERFNDLVVSVYVTAGHILTISTLFYWIPNMMGRYDTSESALLVWISHHILSL
ncbi:trafficking protein particle complex subunit 2-like isoform X4 [Phoenix dactylifera]|uniref:Trafficking protein particle complex subunit 2-like isoform X4 n=1 Tax=Phoenix dactylifera TaxID=42345 RepID=A0A8B8ZPA0_PHODC|nr:trafficking protein particle complex subunit 2-like isoform X4 [Phoenix dactylifera]